MDVFKIKVGISQVIPITIEDFERVTNKRKPYYIENKKGKIMQYAVCPLCDNPIQIIGLYKEKNINSIKPYGRHTSESISELAIYNQEAYNYCPYANPNLTKPNKDERKKNLEGLPLEILDLLKEQLDRIIYLLSRDTDIVFTPNLIKSMLSDFISSDGHLYPWATLANLPWMFAYMIPAQSLFARIIKDNSPLREAILKNVEGVKFNKDGFLSSTKPFLNLHFLFLNHQVPVRNNSLEESVDFAVNYIKGDEEKIIFKKTININQEYFMNLVNLPKEQAKRIKWILDIVDSFFK